MLRKIKRHLRKIVIGYDVSTYYFSQSGEDQILSAIFSSYLSMGKPGFYVDVGAYHPVSHSNTFLFYRNAWTGINIDARSGTKVLFNKTRKKDINLEVGVGNKNEIREYFEISGNGLMNSFSIENIERLGQAKKIISSRQLKMRTLEDILDEYMPRNKTIDFLSVDVEGLDLEVLKSNNWNKYRPRIIVIETEGTTITEVLLSNSSVFLQKLSYDLVAKTLVTPGVSSLIWKDSNWNFTTV